MVGGRHRYGRTRRRPRRPRGRGGRHLFWPAEQLVDLEAACFPASLGGLRASGWQGTDSDARLGGVASCVKDAWLLPLLLARAGDTEQQAYHQHADPEHLYRRRPRRSSR